MRGKTPRARVIFVHGGAYIFKLTTKHYSFIKRLVRDLNIAIYVPLFNVLPTVTIEELNLQIKHAIEHILANVEDKSLILMGDSAGGGSILHLFSDLVGREKITTLFLLSPFVRAYFSEQEYQYGDSRDPIISSRTHKWWAKFINTDITHPQLNPLLKPDLGLAGRDVHIWYGGNEMLLYQLQLLSQRLEEEEDVVLKTYFQTREFHDAPLFLSASYRDFLEEFKNNVLTQHRPA